MPILKNYNHFNGKHWETGSIANYFGHRGVKAPHTNVPYSEAMLMGISGGIVMGYFTFAYEGYDPIMAILTRNTFNPWDTILTRLGVVQEVRQTTKTNKAIANLTDTLEDGIPAIIWADTFTLPYNALGYDEGMWGMFPLIVYGYDTEDDTVWIADRANVPLTITHDDLATTWGRVKKDKHRLMTLDLPDPDKLGGAIQKGIWDTIKLFTEKPPKGSKHNFGFAAYQRWSKLLTKPGQKQSWAKVFPPGRDMIAGLACAYDRIAIFGSDGVADAERTMFADFLEEASLVLNQPDLRDVANQFRASAQAWQKLGRAFLSDEIESFGKIRTLLDQRHAHFLADGNTALPHLQKIDQELEALIV
ncbi:MAG: BtrH N-terminal domain-containing protein [Chloroflexota bacterium]